MKKDRRIGIFICWCGSNIAGTIDIKKVVEELSRYPGVVFCTDYIYMCSDPGQELIKKTIKEKKLDGVVISSCSPTLHEVTFRKTAESTGINPYLLEVANIREQCSWVHAREKEKATEKAIRIIKSMVEKVRMNEPLSPVGVPITKKALIIGGGIAGMQAALDIANSGYEVYVVERNPSIGGHMAQLSETFPTLDCAQCIMTPKMVDVGHHPNIHLLAYSEVEEIKGYVGNFTARIKRKSPFVDWTKCTGCGACAEACVLKDKVSNEFNVGMGKKGAAYIPFPQAVPLKATIDKDNCIFLTKGKCGKSPACAVACEAKAIDFTKKDEEVEIKVGAIVVAIGYDLLQKEKIAEYGYGKYKDVIDSLQFERLNSASGPTRGEIRRPSDSKIPKEVVFIQCVGSRDPEKHFPYCSKICCMYTAKHAMLYKHKVHDGQAYIFYMDIRSGGKAYEEFVQRGVEEDGIFYIRGRVSKVFQEGDKVIVWGADTLTGKKIEIAADMVVLAMAMMPSAGARDTAKKLKISTDQHGFLSEAHPKLRPVETLAAGIYLAGCAQGPKDIPETVAQASGAAAKVVALFSGKELMHEPLVAHVDEEICAGCGVCAGLCAYDAIEIKDKKAKVNEVLCEGCGACSIACPSGAMQPKNYSKKQVLRMLAAATEEG
jgi:heterodisulfide reductase subunit A